MAVKQILFLVVASIWAVNLTDDNQIMKEPKVYAFGSFLYDLMLYLLPTIFVVYLCPHNNLNEGWVWTHCFAYSDNGSRIHFTSNTFFT